MSDLASRKCAPCSGDTPRATGAALRELLRQISGWEAVNEHHLVKQYKFPDFVSALAFVNRVGELAEEQGHHPNITLTWGRVGIEIWTHAIDGLSEADFILAARIDTLPRQ